MPRRTLLRGTAALGALAVAGGGNSLHRRSQTQQTVLRTRVARAGEYRMLPFLVPDGVRRIDVEVTRSDSAAVIGVGLFDARGCGYQSPGFRGMYAGERGSFHVANDTASESFMPGPMDPGTWTVMLPVADVPGPTEVTVRIAMTLGSPQPDFTPGPECGVVVDRPGWYRGDLHCHTTASSDAWASGSALTPAGWARAAREIGMDYLAMTDHNVVTQNYFLARDAGADMLLMPGEEMTNWFHGHATVSGIDVGAWLDFRQAPLGHDLPPNHARIEDFLEVADSMGAYVSAAHPKSGHLQWGFDADAMHSAAARTHGYEVWSGPWTDQEETALRAWDQMLGRGWRVFANGGSDLHGVKNDQGMAVGKPTTVVYAERLAKEDIVRALKQGRSFITRSPTGPEVYLTAELGDQRAMSGGTVHGGVGDEVTARVRVREAAGKRVVVTANGRQLRSVPLRSDDQTVEVLVPVPRAGGYVRAEVRGDRPPSHLPSGQVELDMDALCNPVFLEVGDRPRHALNVVAPVPEHPGPRRSDG